MAGLKISDIINQGKKQPVEKDMHPMVTFEKAQKIIYDNLVEASERFISIGYYLKLIRDNRMYESTGFADLWDFAKSTYGIGKSTASRWMAMNDKYSVDGNSPYIQEKYQGYGKSQLQEMLYLTDEQIDLVKENMTVKEIREIRAPEPVKEEVKEEAVATSQQHGAKWYVRRHFGEEQLKKIKSYFEKESGTYERAKMLQKYLSPYGCSGGSYGDYHFVFHGLARGVEFGCHEINEEITLSYHGLAALLEALLTEKYGAIESKPVEEEMTLEDTCDGKCFNCANIACNCSQVPREYCILDDQYPCTSIHIFDQLKKEEPEIYKGCIGCCNSCPQRSVCGYACNRPNLIEKKRKKDLEQTESYPEMESMDAELCVEEAVPEEIVLEDMKEGSVATSQQNWEEMLRQDMNLILKCLRKERNNIEQMIEAGFHSDENMVKECRIMIEALELLYADKVRRWEKCEDEE